MQASGNSLRIPLVPKPSVHRTLNRYGILSFAKHARFQAKNDKNTHEKTGLEMGEGGQARGMVWDESDDMFSHR